MTKVRVTADFHDRLVNRNKNQGDGRFTAVEFRSKFLSSLDRPEVWENPSPQITLDFSGVIKIGPSFANEAFAYFLKYEKASPESIFQVIKFENISEVQEQIIKDELISGLEID